MGREATTEDRKLKPGKCSPDEKAFLRSGAAGLGAELESDQLEKIDGFIASLIEWNERFSLVGVRTRNDLIRLHVLDSLAIVRVLPFQAALVDIGSGAGLPGLPVAIVRADLRVTLVESRRTKANFQREVVRRLGLRNVEVVEDRVERLVLDRRSAHAFDAATARAWRGLREFLETAALLLRPHGQAIAMKGPKREYELAIALHEASGFAEPETVPYALPGGDEDRALMIFRRR